MKKLPLILLMLMNLSPGGFLPASGQDIHFSQYFYSPLGLNPALTGNYHDGYRINLNYRNQWYAVTTPYKTYSAAFDFPAFFNRRRSVGFGIRMYRDMAGDSKFGTSQADFSLSYTRAFDKRHNQVISAGLSAGLAQRQIDYSKLTFDRQYNGNFFDPSLSQGENIPADNILYPDLGAGLHWSRKAGRGSTFSAGVSGLHLTRPSVSFFNNDRIRLNPRWTAYTSLEYPVSATVLLTPGAAFSYQGNTGELLAGALVKFLGNNRRSTFTSFNAGLYTRVNDAAIVLVGLELQNITAGISYDINYSGLRKASRLQGGPEISFIYNIPNLKARLPKEAICPIF